MLKGHVFSKQLFGNPIFALFINTFLNGINGVSNNYKNGMAVTYSGSTVTVDSGAVCIQGRFLEEDTYTSLSAGTNTAYCKLVIEIDLDKENTESEFTQASYKIITSTSGYPNLTQTNIVKNVAGVYQYELARFRTSSSGISEFQDMRTFLDFTSIYEQITQEYQNVLAQLEEELGTVEDGSAYLLKSGGKMTGNLIANVFDLDGWKYLSFNRLKVISGQITAVASENPLVDYQSVYKDIDYPEGLDFYNTAIFSFTLSDDADTRIYNYGASEIKPVEGYTAGSLPARILLDKDKIRLYVYNFGASDKVLRYRLIVFDTSSSQLSI